MLDAPSMSLRLLPALLASLSLLMTAPLRAQEGGDLQAQILYAYQTEDLNQLADLVQALSAQVKDGDAGPAVRYHLAHAEYRYAGLLGAKRAHDAERALADCTVQLNALLDKTPDSVEAEILSGACYGALADYRRLEAVLLRARAQDRLHAAETRAPRNPRLLLLTATEDLARAKPGTVDAQTAFARLQLAAQLFDETTATDLDKPGWGHAEAYLALGTQLLSRGDRLGARNWIEKALIAAPDYKAAARAQAQLQKH
jgi:tetratricopeptide (TPR) repeat protein